MPRLKWRGIFHLLARQHLIQLLGQLLRQEILAAVDTSTGIHFDETTNHKIHPGCKRRCFGFEGSNPLIQRGMSHEVGYIGFGRRDEDVKRESYSDEKGNRQCQDLPTVQRPCQGLHLRHHAIFGEDQESAGGDWKMGIILKNAFEDIGR